MPKTSATSVPRKSRSARKVAATGSLTIRRLDPRIKAKLRTRAAGNGRSMEEEARRLLEIAVDLPDQSTTGLGTTVNALFRGLGIDELPTLPRTPMRAPPDFGE